MTLEILRIVAGSQTFALIGVFGIISFTILRLARRIDNARADRPKRD